MSRQDRVRWGRSRAVRSLQALEIPRKSSGYAVILVLGAVAGCSASHTPSGMSQSVPAPASARVSDAAVPVDGATHSDAAARADASDSAVPRVANPDAGPREVVSLSDILGVARGKDRYVAVGSQRADASADWRAAVYTSLDGFDWVSSTIDSGPLSDVAFGNGVFVALAHDAHGTSSCTSEDGGAWTCEAMPETAGVAGKSGPSWASRAQTLAFGKGTFVAVLPGSNQILHSKDGRDWRAPTHELGLASVDGVEFGAGVFVAWDGAEGEGSADGEVASSSAGDEWTSLMDATGASPHWIVYLFGGSGGFSGLTAYQCCFGETGGPWFGRLESANGTDWTFEEKAARVALIHEADVCIEMSNSAGVVGDTWSPLSAGSSCDAVSLVPEADGIRPLVALHEGPAYLVGGYGGLVSSKDGLHFQRTL